MKQKKETDVNRVLVPVIAAVVFLVMITMILPDTASADERDEISLLLGAGIAFNNFEGFLIEGGAEFPLKKKIYLQGLFDYYFRPGGNQQPDDYVFSVNLFAAYKHRLSDRWIIYAKAGPNYTVHKTTEMAFGVFYPVRNADFGVGVGAGADYLAAHRLYFYFNVMIKAKMEDNKVKFGDTYWFKMTWGIRYLLGVKKEK
jgi:hypothetical protein